MASVSELAAESQKKKGANSYHFWHGKGGGEAPVPQPKVGRQENEKKVSLEKGLLPRCSRIYGRHRSER